MSQVLSVAKELVKLSLAGDEKDPLTNLRLQKLLYYAQAWSLVVRESELFSDEVEAWRYGPVVPSVYQKMPGGQGDGPIHTDAFAACGPPGARSRVRAECLGGVRPILPRFQLSRMTHQELPGRRRGGAGHQDATGNDAISVIDLEDFFAKQTMPAPLAAYGHELRKREEEAERQLSGLPPLENSRLAAAATSFTPGASLRLRGG